MTTDHLVIFDPPDWPLLAPLAFTRPACALRCGGSTLIENQVKAHRPRRLTLWVRPGVEAVARRLAGELSRRFSLDASVNLPLDSEEAILLDGRTWWSQTPAACYGAEVDDEGTAVRARVSRAGMEYSHLDELLSDAGASGGSVAQCIVLRRPWDLIRHNRVALAETAEGFAGAPLEQAGPGVHILGKEAGRVQGEVQIDPGVVLDGRSGPICLSEGVRIGANSVVTGPCFLGPQTQVMPLSRIGPFTSAGRYCKLAGEVGNAIIHGFANKAHEGFLGDSYLGAWVNLGAATITSNLKNTYGPIRAQTAAGRVETAETRLGTVFGDHSKLGIGSHLSAGTYVGVGSQLAVDRPPMFTPSFRFVTPAGDEAADLERVMAVARTVAERRQLQWTPEDVDLIRHAHRIAGEIERR